MNSLWLAVFVMSFLGSWHCGVMCGPISCNFRKSDQFFSYHIGRLISYSGITVLLYFGTHYFLDSDSRGLKMITSLILGVLLILFGFGQLNLLPQQKRTHFFLFKIQSRVMTKYRKALNKFPVLLGLLTGFFPCGWLYSFVILASQRESVSQALAVIGIFWLTSLPAFIVFTGFMAQLIKKSPVSYQRISAIILIVAGLFSILGHWADIVII